jgi:hypothetical protein
VKEEYGKFLKREETPIFYWPEWLDAVSQNTWQVEIFKNKGGETIAALPYVVNKIRGFTTLQAPAYTPFLGPLEYVSADKIQTAYKQGYEICEQVIEFLKKFDEVNFRLKPGFAYWLPFRWAGFTLSPRITYQIEPASEAELWDGLDPRVRTDIRKAQEKAAIRVEISDDVNLVFNLYKHVFDRKERRVPMTLEWLRNLDVQLRKASASQILIARTSEGQAAAMAYLLEDHRKVYLFLTGIAPEHKKTAALSLLIWQAIKTAAEKGKAFDFEGSIIPEVEYFFRGFGGIQETFFEVKGTRNRLLRLSRKVLEGLRSP